jgi:hypothetical protein
LSATARDSSCRDGGHSGDATTGDGPRKPVVIMGMGMVPVFKSDVSAFYDRLQASESGVGPIDRFYASSFPTRFTAQIRGFTSEGYIDAKNDKRLHDCIRYYIVSGRKALEDTGLSNGSDAHTKVSLCVRVCAPARHRWFIISRILRCTKTLYAMFPEKKRNYVCTAIHFGKQPVWNFHSCFPNSAHTTS